MPVFRLGSDDGSMQSFAKILHRFLDTFAKSGGIELIDLSPNMARFQGAADQSDTLLARGGVPLAAVYIEVKPVTERIDGYVDSPAYGGCAGGRPVAIKTIDDDLAQRLRAEMPKIESEPPPAPESGLIEMSWRILIRSSGMPTLGWQGGPFDTDKIEAAFNKLVDVVVAASKPSTSA
jgi:hypothetical protein